MTPVNIPLLCLSAALVAAGFVLIERSRFGQALIGGGLWLFTAAMVGFDSPTLAVVTAGFAGVGLAKGGLFLRDRLLDSDRSWIGLWRSLVGLPQSICDRPLSEKIEQLEQLGWMIREIGSVPGIEGWWVVCDSSGRRRGSPERDKEAAVDSALMTLVRR